MSSFAAIKKASSRRPERFCIIRPDDYADTYEGTRPTGNEAAGIAILSESEVQDAADLARRTADERCSVRDSHWLDCYNDKLVAVTVAGSLVDPNDVTRKFFKSLDLELTLKLKTSAIQRLWGEVELAHLSTSPLVPEAGDEELAHLVVLIERGTAWEKMSRAEIRQCRKFLEAARDLLEQAESREAVAANG